MLKNSARLTPSKKIAYSAVAAALLIAAQLALSAAQGVEVVTVMLLSFSYVFGVWCGVFSALTFSLLRCFIFGFYPSVIVLYIIYYPAFALVCGLLGRISNSFYESKRALFIAAVNIICLSAAAGATATAATGAIHVAPAADIAINTAFYILGGAFLALAATCNLTAVFLKGDKRANSLKVICATGVAALFTICFTLLDDVITPLFMGMTQQTALTYFFVSFTAMLPQTICAIVTVSTLFLPVTSALRKVL